MYDDPPGPAGGGARHFKRLTRAETDDILSGQMLGQAHYTVLAGAAVALVVYAGLRGAAGGGAVDVWLALALIVAAGRLTLLARWRRRPGNLKRRARAYAAATGAAGAVWAALLLCYGPDLPLAAQVLILVTLVAMPVAAVPGNALHPPTHALFSLPILLGLLLWSVALAPGLKAVFLATGAAYAGVVWILAGMYARNLRRSVQGYVENRRLVADLEAANARLERAAHTDPLTGLGNRRWFQDRLDAALGRCRRHGTPLALLAIDVDHFKAVNDRNGHEVGDRTLVALAGRLRGDLRQGDAVVHSVGQAARMGGDEFMVLLENVGGMDDAVVAAGRIRRRIREEVRPEDGAPALTLSIGIALAPRDATERLRLMRAADEALYHAKLRGRDRHEVYRPGLDRAGLATAAKR